VMLTGPNKPQETVSSYCALFCWQGDQSSSSSSSSGSNSSSSGGNTATAAAPAMSECLMQTLTLRLHQGGPAHVQLPQADQRAYHYT
jgi:hypothetical protein